MAGSLNMNAYSLNVKGDNNDNNLMGTSESDRLDGKNGNDVLFGDLGSDSFKCGKGVDTIKDFNSAEGDRKSSDCEKIGSRDSSNGGATAKLVVDPVQSNVQNIKCEIKGFFGSIDDSCFNANNQNLANKGGNLASQNGDYGKVGLGIGVKDGNSADPAISQAQSNVQNVQCVSGGSIDDSCFNYNNQNLANKGNIALAQDGGNGKGSGDSRGDGDADDGSGSGNSADPAISQAQSNVQNVQCVSGKDAIVSCNNVSFQNQNNEGNVALGQIY